LFDKITTVQLV